MGPTIEYAYPEHIRLALQEDCELSKILPFLALPDGAHLVSAALGTADPQSEEDYSYFVRLRAIPVETDL